MSVSVGIDLGTTFSAVAYIDPRTGSPQVIPNGEGKKLTPSVIQFYDGETIFGSEAETSFNAGEENCAATFKRGMGEDDPWCFIDGKPLTSEELSSMLLRHLKEEAEMVLGDSISEAVITVPAYFYSKEREATLRAAQAAGIKVKKIIDEPNAAALAYGLNHWRENANILVYDLGGGTFDVTLVHMGKDGNLETVATRGDHLLGGRDWDDRMQDILIERFEEETGLDIRENVDWMGILNGMSEGIKKQLSAPGMTTTKVTASFPGYGQSSVVIRKDEFENRTNDLLDRTGALCRAVLEELNLSVKDVTDVLLVGGSTRMPQVSDYLYKLFGKRPLSHVNPDEAVALGAAIQSTKARETYASLSVLTKDGKKQTDHSTTGLVSRSSVKTERKLGGIEVLSLRETTAHAMGIVAIDDEGNHYYNEIIIPANHPRPVRAAKRFRFYTSADGDNELAIFVLQGDSEDPADCQIPYKYVVNNIRHVPKGESFGTVIRVQYSYDENGIIRIQARQERDKTDLPIRRESAVGDVERFSKPVVQDDKEQGLSLGLQMLQSRDQSVVHKYKAINFSNVSWEKYDRIFHHPSGAQYNEPSVHIVANEENIEFHGYNVSAMDEGVTYTISASDDFEIECDIDTSTINPHPGGHLIIGLGLISAELNEQGGRILLDGNAVANVGSRFHLRMSLLDGGHYEVFIDKESVGTAYRAAEGAIDVLFGFVHDAHCCHLLSHAYVSSITMLQRSGDVSDDSAETETWDD